MFMRSQRTATKVGDDLLTSTALPTIRDFLALLNSRGVERVQRESTSIYCTKILSSSGSQFTVFTDDGIRETGKPVGVVKGAKFQLRRDNHAPSDSARVRLSMLVSPRQLLTVYSVRSAHSRKNCSYSQTLVSESIQTSFKFCSMTSLKKEMMLPSQSLSWGELSTAACTISFGKSTLSPVTRD